MGEGYEALCHSMTAFEERIPLSAVTKRTYPISEAKSHENCSICIYPLSEDSQHDYPDTCPRASTARTNKSLPMEKIWENHGDYHNRGANLSSMNIQGGGRITILDCGHSFHQKCVADWLHWRPLCPNCRTGIEEEVEESRNEDDRPEKTMRIEEEAGEDKGGEQTRA